MNTEDKDLFLSAMQDVTPLTKDNKVSSHNPQEQNAVRKQTLTKLKQKKRAINQANFKLDTSQIFSKVGAFEKMKFSQHGVQQRELNRLKNGNFSVESCLDLHGNTLEEAEVLLSRFLSDAINGHLRFIRIIHGKGYNSENEFPALKNLTNQFLRQCPQVIAFSSAAEKDGGVGAVNILLKN